MPHLVFLLLLCIQLPVSIEVTVSTELLWLEAGCQGSGCVWLPHTHTRWLCHLVHHSLASGFSQCLASRHYGFLSWDQVKSLLSLGFVSYRCWLSSFFVLPDEF